MCFTLFPGMTFNSRTIGEGLNSKSKSAVVKRSSTLMKPTASQLAKQNRPPQIVGSRWLLKELLLYLRWKDMNYYYGKLKSEATLD